jgi:hypothetical protein
VIEVSLERQYLVTINDFIFEITFVHLRNWDWSDPFTETYRTDKIAGSDPISLPVCDPYPAA